MECCKNRVRLNEIEEKRLAEVPPNMEIDLGHRVFLSNLPDRYVCFQSVLSITADENHDQKSVLDRRLYFVADAQRKEWLI